MHIPNSTSPNPHPYPWMVTVAGVIWIVMGSGIILNLVLLVLGTGRAPGVSKPDTVSLVVMGTFLGMVGCYFHYEGICIYRGTIPDMMSVTIGSFAFAALYVGLGLLLPGPQRGIDAILPWIVAALLVVAGILALVSRTPYDDWWKWEHHQRDTGIRN
jgi:hypothetical protein